MAHGDMTHIEIPVSDISRATPFYNTIFRWQIKEMPGFEGYPMWQTPNGAGGGGLAPRDESFTQPRIMVDVDSIEETIAEVERLGGSVVTPKSAIDETSWWAVIADHDGNHVGLFEGQVGGGEGAGD